MSDQHCIPEIVLPSAFELCKDYFRLPRCAGAVHSMLQIEAELSGSVLESVYES